MDEVIVRSIAPDHPEIAQAAREDPLGPVPLSGESDVDMDDEGPNGVTPAAPPEPKAPPAGAGGREDLVNTAQHALLAAKTLAGRRTSPSRDSVVGDPPPPAAQGAGDMGPAAKDAGPNAASQDERSARGRRSGTPGSNRNSNASGDDAADVLVRLKDRSPKATPTPTPPAPASAPTPAPAPGSTQTRNLAPVDGYPARMEGDQRPVSLSTGPNPATLMTVNGDDAPPQTLPTIVAADPSRRYHKEGPPPRVVKPSLPPLHSHLNELANVAAEKSIQTLDRRGSGSGSGSLGRAPPCPLTALSARHSRSPPPLPAHGHGPAGIAKHDRPRMRVPYMTGQQHPPFIPAQQPPSPYGPSHVSPAGSYDGPSLPEPFRHGRDVSASPPSPELGQASSPPYYQARRPSHASDDGPAYGAASLPEGSYPPAGPPMVDGGGPRDVLPAGQSLRPSLNQLSSSAPKPPNGHANGGGYRCLHPGCEARPFQTQYLLNSHANVHSQDRPHYCSVPYPDCPRGEGGRGFKRKNEMIRHGLVHASPGYICPFCPDKEHKYPRPDNLQRHVRARHGDKKRDDPALRRVLSQRQDGGHRGRRRRTGP